MALRALKSISMIALAAALGGCDTKDEPGSAEQGKPTIAAEGSEEKASYPMAPASPRSFSDSELEVIVERNLRADRTVYTPALEIEVKDGIASITGAVDDQGSKQRAIEIASSTQGVKKVVTDVKVVPATTNNRRQRVQRTLQDD